MDFISYGVGYAFLSGRPVLRRDGRLVPQKHVLLRENCCTRALLIRTKHYPAAENALGFISVVVFLISAVTFPLYLHLLSPLFALLF